MTEAQMQILEFGLKTNAIGFGFGVLLICIGIICAAISLWTKCSTKNEVFDVFCIFGGVLGCIFGVMIIICTSIEMYEINNYPLSYIADKMYYIIQ